MELATLGRQPLKLGVAAHRLDRGVLRLDRRRRHDLLPRGTHRDDRGQRKDGHAAPP
jgi:hypothetical protein